MGVVVIARGGEGVITCRNTTITFVATIVASMLKRGIFFVYLCEVLASPHLV